MPTRAWSVFAMFGSSMGVGLSSLPRSVSILCPPSALAFCVPGAVSLQTFCVAGALSLQAFCVPGALSLQAFIVPGAISPQVRSSCFGGGLPLVVVVSFPPVLPICQHGQRFQTIAKIGHIE